MKITNFLPVVILSVLMVGAVSCTTMQPMATDEYETISSSRQQPPARIYVDDPYNYGRTIVMDRDPVTGRYYQVNTYPVYDRRYDSRYYGDNRYDSRYSRDRNYNSREVYRQPEQRPTTEQIKQGEQKRQEAGSILFGKKQ